MNLEKRKELAELLLKFVKEVVEGKTTSDARIAVLPEVVKELKGLI